MRLQDYVQMRWNGNASAFARHAGVPQQSMSRFLAGEAPNLRTAAKIVRAAKNRVTFWDLLPEGWDEDAA